LDLKSTDRNAHLAGLRTAVKNLLFYFNTGTVSLENLSWSLYEGITSCPPFEKKVEPNILDISILLLHSKCYSLLTEKLNTIHHVL